MLHILNKREQCTLKGAKLIILSVFFWRIDTLCLAQLVRIKTTQT